MFWNEKHFEKQLLLYFQTHEKKNRLIVASSNHTCINF